MLTREISRFGHIIQPLSPWSCGSYWLMAFKSQWRRTYSNRFLKNIFKSFFEEHIQIVFQQHKVLWPQQDDKMVGYLCSKCDHEPFTTDWSLERHYVAFHKKVEGRLFKCPYCYEDQFDTKWDRLCHIYFAHRYAKHCTLYPHEDFESAHGLRRHFKGYHEKGGRHRCRFCAVLFETKYELETHFSIAHKQRWRCRRTPNSQRRPVPGFNNNSTTKWLAICAPSATTHRSTRRTDWKGIMFRIIRKLRDAFSHAVFVTKTDLKLNGRNIFTWSLRIGRPSIATYAGMKISNRPLHYDSISSGTTQKEKQDTTIRYESF